MVKLFNFPGAISILRNSELVSNIDKIHVDEISQRGFYKIRCSLLPAKYKLEIKFVKTSREFIYSYQLFTTQAIARWDNEPHFPNIKTFPHHFHDVSGTAFESDLTGHLEKDLKLVLLKVKGFLSTSSKDDKKIDVH